MKHFLTPIIASLDTAHPLLDRTSLTAVFSNFIDIWNLHRSFFSSLSTVLFCSRSTATPPPLSPILLSHFPYLSLYTPFITSFHTTITSLTNMLSPTSPSYNQAFASFLAEQESNNRCGKLKLRDWMLTIVQRCPRYLLLLKDLISCTDAEDNEHQQLTIVHGLVSKSTLCCLNFCLNVYQLTNVHSVSVTLSLNTSLHTHAQTLALLALQRSTSSLPPNLHFISPGRLLLRRGPLMMLDPRGEAHAREFLLFSDCLVWLENESGYSVIGVGWANVNGSGSGMMRPNMIRSRSKSEAELSGLKTHVNASALNFGSPISDPPQSESNLESPPHSAPVTGPNRAFSSIQHPIPRAVPANVKRHASSISPSSQSTSHAAEEKWIFKGKAKLVDLDIVLVSGMSNNEDGQERRFEVWSPEGSFAVYAGTYRFQHLCMALNIDG
jgi:FYVE/RhoGEF/PH domain-containing protein 5/6